MAQPDVAVVLNVQGAHLGEFGSQQTIARTKGELVEALGPDGVAVLNVDDPATAAMAFLAPGRVVTFGFDERAHIRGSDLEEDRFGLMSFTVEDARPAREPAPGEPPDFDRGRPMRVTTRLVGGHQASNVLAALAAGVALGVPLIRAVGALDGVGPMSPHRMAVTPLESGAVLVDDSYNASPDAVTAAVKTVGRMGAAAGMAPTAVLAGMRELGSSQGRKHREVGRTLVREGFGHVYLVGTPAVAYEPGLLDAGMDPERIHFRPDKTGLARELAASALPGEHILLKGPHAAELWLIADDLTAGSEPR
jgi:UDP-N-acetylmuramoyl-tripeptide--D-alanyl-D-alanine ligase